MIKTMGLALLVFVVFAATAGWFARLTDEAAAHSAVAAWLGLYGFYFGVGSIIVPVIIIARWLETRGDVKK